MSDRSQVKPGEYFEAAESEVPQAFRDTIVPAEDPKIEVKKEEATAKVKLQKRTTGWYDVVDQEGNVLNKQALRHQEAVKMVEKHK